MDDRIAEGCSRAAPGGASWWPSVFSLGSWLSQNVCSDKCQRWPSPASLASTMHAVCLAAAAGAAEENLEHRARQQGLLRPRLRLPPDSVRSGGVLAGGLRAGSKGEAVIADGENAARRGLPKQREREWPSGARSHPNAQPMKGASGRRERRPWPSRHAGRLAGSDRAWSAACMRAAARRLPLLPAAPARWRGWQLPWGGQRPAVFLRVRSSRDRGWSKTAGRAFRIRFTCTTIWYSINDSARRGTGFVDRECRAKREPACFFLPPAPESDSLTWIFDFKSCSVGVTDSCYSWHFLRW